MAAGPMTVADVVAKNASHKDLSDKIVMLEADDYPLFSRLPKTSGQKNLNKLSEWPVNKRPNAIKAVTGEGRQETYNRGLENYGIIKNRMMLNTIGVSITDQAEDSQNLAGVASKWQETIVEHMVQAKRSLESHIGSDVPVREGDGSKGNPDWSRAVGAYVTDSTSDPAGYQIPVAHRTPTGSIYSGTLAALDETGSSSSFQSILGSIYDEAKSKVRRTLYAGRRLKAHVSIWAKEADNTNAVVRNFNSSTSRRLETIVNVIDTDAGMVDIVLCAFLGAFDSSYVETSALTQQMRGYLLEEKNWELNFLRQPRLVDEPKFYGEKTAVIEWQYQVKALCPRGDGKIVPSALT